MSWHTDFKYDKGKTVFYIYGTKVEKGVISDRSVYEMLSGWSPKTYSFEIRNITTWIEESDIFPSSAEAATHMKKYKDMAREAKREAKRIGQCPTCSDCGGTGYSQNSDCGGSCSTCWGTGRSCD